MYATVVKISTVYVMPVMFTCMGYMQNALAVALQKACKNNLIIAEFYARGGHTNDCLGINLTNKTPAVLPIEIEPGMRFINGNEQEQDLIVVKAMKFKLQPGKQLDTALIALCCESTHSSPRRGQKMTGIAPADSNLYRVCKQIDLSKVPAFIGQTAVWIVSNNHSINGLPLDCDTALLKLCARISGQKPGWYHCVYTFNPERVYSGTLKEIWINYAFTKKTNDALKIWIADKNGKVVMTLLNDSYRKPGEYVLRKKLGVQGWKKGRYYVYTSENDEPGQLKEIEI